MNRATLLLALGPVLCGPAVAAWASIDPAPTPSTGTSAVQARQPTSTSTATSPAKASTTKPATTSSDPTSRSAGTQPNLTKQSTAQSGSTTQSTTTPAPAGDSQATALGIGNLLAIGHTKAHADSSGGSATANAVELNGKPLIGGKTGGSQTGNGNTSGSLLDTGDTPLGRLMLTPWMASASSTGTSSHAASDAALAHATVIDSKTLDIWALHSTSSADYTAAQSSGQSTSDGAKINAGDGALVITVLHSETKSGQKGSSSLLSINGNDIGSSDQANGACAIDIPQLLRLTCLDASGGTSTTGQTTSAADVGNLNVGSGQLTGVVSGTQSTGQNAPAKQTKVLGEKIPRTSSEAGNRPTAAPAAGTLPFTGSEIGLFAALGATLTAFGAALMRIARRRPWAATG